MTLRATQKTLRSISSKLQELKWPDVQLRSLIVYHVAPLIEKHKELQTYFSTMTEAHDVVLASLNDDELDDTPLTQNFESTVYFNIFADYLLYWQTRIELINQKDSEDSFKIIQRASVIVCQNIATYIDSFEPQSLGRKHRIKYLGNGKLMYKGEEYQMAKESFYSKVCDIIYSNCQHVGSSIPIATVYKMFQPQSDYRVDELRNRKLIQYKVADANRWALRHKLPRLFSTESGKVIREI